MVAVDQFEELFTLCDSEEERAGFLEELVAAARDVERRALIVVSLRADFYGRLASYPAFGGLLSASHVLVGPMDREELARAIEQPAARAGLELERGLADALVSDVAGEPGGLPLLSTTLLELWRVREGRVLRLRQLSDERWRARRRRPSGGGCLRPARRDRAADRAERDAAARRRRSRRACAPPSAARRARETHRRRARPQGAD